MTNSRALVAQRLFRLACLLWVFLLLGAEIWQPSDLRQGVREAAWELSAGTLALLWAGLALWSGSVRLGYRGVRTRTVVRSEAAGAFWMHLGIGAMIGVLLVAFGVVRLMRL
jgi:hypothetical protein